MVVYSWNFAFVKRQPWKKKFNKINNFSKVVKFISNVLKTFVITLCYNNDENCDLLKL
jgi:hypothetical protein